MRQFNIIILVILISISCRDSSVVLPGRVKYQNVIKGQIIDKYFNKPAYAVNMKLTPGYESTFSNRKGMFNFENLEDGTFQLITSHDLYYPDTIEVKFNNKDTVDLKFALERKDTNFRKFNLSFFEGWTTPSCEEIPFIRLFVETEEIFGCSNLRIATNNYISGQTIQIEYERIYLPENYCANSEGPARAFIPIKIKNGMYLLKFKQQDIEDKYFLKISDRAIEINESEKYLTNIDYLTYWRYPKNSFVYMCGTRIEDKWICEDFLDTLKSYIDITEFNFPDSGKICYPTASMGHYYDMPAKYFYYNNEDDYIKIDSILMKYNQNVLKKYSGVGISIYNWKNKRYQSWMYY